jgi:hypothetical protein
LPTTAVFSLESANRRQNRRFPLALSVVRIIFDFSLIYYIIPGYFISLALSLFVPPFLLEKEAQRLTKPTKCVMFVS